MALLMIKLSNWAWVACGWIDHFTVVVTRMPQSQICHLHSKYMIGVLQLKVNKRRKKTEENSRECVGLEPASFDVSVIHIHIHYAIKG